MLETFKCNVAHFCCMHTDGNSNGRASFSTNQTVWSLGSCNRLHPVYSPVSLPALLLQSALFAHHFLLLEVLGGNRVISNRTVAWIRQGLHGLDGPRESRVQGRALCHVLLADVAQNAGFTPLRPEAIYMDAQQRLLLHRAAEVLAVDDSQSSRSEDWQRTSVMVGIGTVDYITCMSGHLGNSLYAASGEIGPVHEMEGHQMPLHLSTDRCRACA